MAAPNRLQGLWLSAFSAVLGALPDHVGQFRLASAYLRRRPPAPAVAVQRMRGGLRAALDVGDRTQGIAYLTRRYEPELVDFIVERLPRDGVFVDVGAHIGLISLAVARRRPGARVIAFEPAATNADAWWVNRELNGLANAELTRSAVAARTGRMAFHEDRDSAAGYLGPDGSSSVEAGSLDDLLDDRAIAHVDVLKIDTEGGEGAVLEGARRLLATQAIACVVCELNTVHLARHGQSPEDIVAMLQAAGLRQVELPPARSRLRARAATPRHVVDLAFERIAQPGEPGPA